MAARERLQHGTWLDVDGDGIAAVRSACGRTVVEATWADGVMASARLLLPSLSHVEIVTAGGEHPVLGPVHALKFPMRADDPVYFGRVRWDRPESIPPLDRPAAMPAGAGAAVLNFLAITAFRRHAGALRYCGPYATAALFDALLVSFAVAGEPSLALARFTEDVEHTAVAGTMRWAPVDFVPAPHEWTWPDPRVCVQRREGIERIWVDGVAFDRRRVGPRRVVDRGDTAVACVMLGDAIWAEVAVIDGDGMLVAGPSRLPAAPAELVGTPLPSEVCDALVDVVAARAPAVLRAAVRGVLERIAITWQDTGMSLARAGASGIELHAGLLSALPTDPRALLHALLHLVEPVALSLARMRLVEVHDAMLRR